MKTILLSLSIILCLLTGCSSQQKDTPSKEPLQIIFETDMGNDIDDALALDMIYKYMEEDRADMLAVMTNRDSKYSAEFIDIMATWYGFGQIPIGIVRNGANAETGKIKYDQAVCELSENGQPMFSRTLNDYESLLDAHILYRKILAEQPDTSVVVISVGFSTNIARLLETTADEYSPLSGKDLVAKKVKLLSVMGGSIKENLRKEYNIVKDIPSARKVYAEWPSPIVTSPFEVGAKIKYPATSIENDFNWGIRHPMVEAYKAYDEMPYDRPTWDLTSVLYVTEPDSAFWDVSPPGTIRIQEDGVSLFNADPQGKHTYFTVNDQQAQSIKEYFIRLISQKPGNVLF
jgi:inosine-uridine nucleoside N-ribohydrolase